MPAILAWSIRSVARRSPSCPTVAEGFERGATAEFIQFLFIAKGSSGEVRAQLQIAADQGYITTDEHARLNDLCRRISGMISNFIAHLQGSDYRGEKFTRPQRRSVEAASIRQDALRAAQLASMRASHPHKPADPA